MSIILCNHNLKDNRHMKEWLSVKDIATELAITEDTVRTWIREKELIAVNIGRGYRIHRDEYQKFLKSRSTDKDREPHK